MSRLVEKFDESVIKPGALLTRHLEAHVDEEDGFDVPEMFDLCVVVSEPYDYKGSCEFLRGERVFDCISPYQDGILVDYPTEFDMFVSDLFGHGHSSVKVYVEGEE